MQLAVIAAHAEALDHRLAVHGDFAMADHHPLGLAGGTGGVDQVGLMARQGQRRQGFAAVSREAVTVLFQAPATDLGGQLAEGLKQRTLAQQQFDAAVFNHVVQAFQRVFRIQWHIGATGLEDRQQADYQLQRALQGQADAHLRADAMLTQHTGQLVGAGVKLGVAQVLPGERQGRGIRLMRGLLAEQLMNVVIQRQGVVSLERIAQSLLLDRRQQRQFAQALLGITQHCHQQVLPVGSHLRDTRRVEQVAAVGQAATQAAVEVGDFQVKVELGSAGIVYQILDLHAGQLTALLELPALDVAHHLEQRVVGAAAWWLQGLDQLIEGQVLMGLAVDHGLAHLLDQLADTHLPIKLATQHLGVEEGTDQAFAFRADAVGHRRADAQVSLAAVAVEQHGQGCGHGHEQGQAALGIKSTYSRCQLRAQVEAIELATVTLHRRTRTVGRQFEYRMLIAQFGLPVVQLALALAAFQPLALPHAVVQVLHRQGLQRRFALVDKSLVELAQLAGEDVHGPAFGDDVVQRQHEEVLTFVDLDQAGAQQRPPLQVEGLVRLVVGQLLQTLLAGIV
ncbi:hypothetical protein D3C79_465130 [compost metagenome]